jgi:hypothetical protein
MTDTLPERTIKQRRDALVRANEVRAARADIKKQVRSGTVHVTAVIQRPDRDLLGMKVEELLTAQPWRGQQKARRVMTSVGISARKTIGGLTPRQRVELIKKLS